MTDTAKAVESAESSTAEPLSLIDELILMLLDEKGGYFHQVPGWQLNCAVVGGVLAELSFRSRLDSDLASLFVVDPTETGDPLLDPILKEVVDEPGQRTARYWVERLAPRAESIIDLTLERLVERGILEHHDGEFWTLAPTVLHAQAYGISAQGTPDQFIKARIGKVLFADEIPDPRDVVIVCLVNTCDVFRLIFQLDEEVEERIKYICQMDLIGRSIADAVSRNAVGPIRRHSALAKKIPTVPLPRLLANPHVRDGNLNALFGHLAEEYGPVFRIRPPLAEPMTFLAGLETNRWVHKHGRSYLRTRDYFSDFEKVYGAAGVLPALDGADHFRLRKFLAPAYSQVRLGGQMDQLYDKGRAYMASLKVGDSYRATSMCRALVNAQLSPLFIGVDTQDLMDDCQEFPCSALTRSFPTSAMPWAMTYATSGTTTSSGIGTPTSSSTIRITVPRATRNFLEPNIVLIALPTALLLQVYISYQHRRRQERDPPPERAGTSCVRAMMATW
ncbi:GPP34 family phosphoprotein [Candidatus Palauibacter sp.]|uniref:GPP34 family phosphoprotein n=1 Tax=Candidatus Palauibacter sp. TaxID=3101350 RepID=UPI003B51C102